MERSKKELLEKTYREFMRVGLVANNPNLLDGLVDKNIMGFGTAIDEKILGIEEFKKLLINQKIQSQGLDIAWRHELVHLFISEDENSAVFAENLIATIKTGEEAVEMFMRFSSVLNYSDDQWKVVHWHGSKPEEVESEKDTWGIDFWKQKTEELEKRVEEKTADLVEKNRELEIEAALERVRASSLAMHHTSELGDVVEVLFQEFSHLKLKFYQVWINIFNLEKGTSDCWFSPVEGVFSKPYTTVVPLEPFEETSIKSWRAGEEFSFLSWRGLEEVDAISKSLTEMTGHPSFQKIQQTKRMDRMEVVDCNHKYGVVAMAKNEEITTADLHILKRFSQVFEQTYTRFLDLKKAEAQAREAQIEAALERARSVSMAMHESDELVGVATTFYQQLIGLGFDSVVSGGFNFPDAENKITHCWFAETTDESLLQVFRIPFAGDSVLDERHEYRKKGIPFLEQVLKKEEVERHMEFVFPNDESSNEELAAREAMPNPTIFSIQFLNEGYMILISVAPLSEEQKSIMGRFANVFNSAYTRFLDLKKAEAQARESEIQLALERVRARTMAMQHSDELMETSELMFEQIKNLGVELWSCGFSLWFDDDSYFLGYNPGPHGKLGNPLKIPLTEDIFFTTIREAKRRGDEFLVFESSGKSLAETYRYMDGLPVVGETLRGFVDAGFQLPTFQVTHCGFFPNGHLMFILQEHNPEAENIFKRFTKVFNQTYTRFLDLQKAESQARESAIQLSLERVRARSMSMQQSDELHDVLSVLFEQFYLLGIEPVNVFLSLFDKENKTLTYRATGTRGSKTQGQQVISLDSLEVWQELFKKWQNDNSDSVEVIYYPKEILPTLFDLLKETFSAMPENERMSIDQFPDGGYTAHGYTPFGYIGFNHLRMPTDEEKEILSKFASEFSRVYQRFLDIEKAEAQAREAQIEVALERIRARAMAMHHPDELSEVLALMFEQLSHLGVEAHWTHLTLMDLENNTFVYRMTSKDGQPVHAEQVVHLDAMDTWSHTVETFKSQNPETITQIHFSPEVLPKVWELFDGIFSSLPEESKMNPEDFPNGIHTTESNCKFGYLGINQSREATAEEKKILGRFGSEFGRLYQRYLDIEKAQKQAREAQIEASLERIRARAMAMHHPNELSEVLTLMFAQLDLLGVETAWTHLTLVDLEKNTFTYRMTGREGKRVDVEQVVALDASPVWIHATETFKSEKPDTITRIEFKPDTLPGLWDLFDGIFPALPEGYQIFPEDFPKGLFTTQANCKYGYLGINQPRKATEEEEKILARFGSEFGRLYQRYLDIERAQKQAREAQIEASLERVRARAMAMHQTDELTDVLCVLFDQFDLLGINPVLTHLTLFDEANETFSIRLTTTADNGVVAEQLIDIHAIEAWKQAFAQWKSCEPNSVNTIDYAPEDLPYLWELLSEVMSALPEGHKINPEDFPNGLFTTQGHFQFGYLGFNHSRKASEEEKSIVSRFAREFGRTYQRYLDIEKAEAQAREAQIEMALERVRSRSMAMQKSDEMLALIKVVFDQLRLLDINFDHASFAKNLQEGDFTFWTTYKGQPEPIYLEVPTMNSPVLSRVYEAKKKGLDFITDFFTAEENKEWSQHLIKFSALKFMPEPIKKFMLNAPGFHRSSFLLKDIDFYVGSYGSVPFTDQENAIFKRFAQVFQQSYTRFLDLQKAEAQAREARIETALEKIRSRTMAMQKGEELQEVAVLLYKELIALGVTNFVTCGYVEVNENIRRQHTWVTAPGGDTMGLFHLPLTGDDTFDERYAAWKKQQKIFHQSVAGKVRSDHLEYAITTFNSKEAEEMVRSQFPDPTVFYCFNFPHGYLHTVGGSRLEKDEELLLARFTKVFAQTYTRFLDLKKAEAQAREARVEAALEKVRSRTMGMQSSEELPEVANLLFTEVRALGIHAWSCGYNILAEDKKTATCCMSSEGTLQTPFQLRLWGEASFDEMGEFVLSDNKMLVQELGGKALEEHYSYMKSFPDLKPTFDEIDRLELSLPTYQINHLCKFNQGFILFITYEKVPDAHDIFKRFTKVFDQTYTRFLDLKKAEAQAREAQIANALEKVRSRSLAMQSPDELIDVAQLLREEMGALGVEELETSSIYIHDQSSGLTQCWFTIKDTENPGKSVTDQMIINLQDTWVGQQMHKFYVSKKDKTSSILMKGDQRVEWIRYCEEKSELFSTQAFYGETIPERTYHLCKFSNGYIGAAAPGEISQESWDLLERATSVFSFAYTRFQDLQKAEASALAAMRQASLDRIRADISSMRHADDLDRITPLIFKELTVMGVPFIRCGVFIIQEQQEIIEAYLSSPDGNSLGALKLPYKASDLTYQTVKAWRKGEVLRKHWNKEDFVQWIKELMEQDQIQDSKTYQGTAAPPESLDLHFIPFTQGMLYIGNVSPLDEKELELAESLANAFSIAYARFEDFVKLEQAKSKVESAMSELKATQSQLVQQEKLASLGQLTAGIAHEIKNPLNFVNNFSEVSIELIEEIKEERSKSQETRDETLVDEILQDIKANLEKVNEHGTRANGIVTSMLQHSRGGSGNKEPTDLNALIKEYVNLSFHGMRAGKNPINVDIILDLDDQLDRVSLIKEDFTRVIINLCNNAFDAMRVKTQMGLKAYQPQLTVQTKTEKNRIQISVEDNGPGIPEDIKDKILQPFFTTKKGTEGTGLGLSITNDIIKAHGGRLDIQSQPGHTIFSIHLKL